MALLHRVRRHHILTSSFVTLIQEHESLPNRGNSLTVLHTPTNQSQLVISYTTAYTESDAPNRSHMVLHTLYYQLIDDGTEMVSGLTIGRIEKNRENELGTKCATHDILNSISKHQNIIINALWHITIIAEEYTTNSQSGLLVVGSTIVNHRKYSSKVVLGFTTRTLREKTDEDETISPSMECTAHNSSNCQATPLKFVSNSIPEHDGSNALIHDQGKHLMSFPTMDPTPHYQSLLLHSQEVNSFNENMTVS